MYKILISQFKQYKKAALLTPVFTGLEALMELLIPFITAKIIDEGIQAGNLSRVYFYGGIMLVMAFLSLCLGVLAGKNAAEASWICLQPAQPDVRKYPDLFLLKH